MILKNRMVLLTSAFCLMAACSKVPVGNVGVIVDLYGSSKGVQNQQVGTGRYWVGWNQELYLFPTFWQTRTWSDENKEEIQFQSVENMPILADIGITYKVDPSKVSILFQTYKLGIDEITDTFIHNMVRDAFVEKASNMPIEDIYGKRKVELLTSVETMIKGQVAPIGIEVQRVYLVGRFKLPAQIEGAINSKMAAQQKAEQTAIEIQGSKNEADKTRAKAQGDADAVFIRAKAEAEAIKVKADALNASPQLVQWEAVNKWNGVLPQVSGGSTPFINLSPAK